MPPKAKAVASPLDRFPRATSTLVPRIIGASIGDYGTGRTRFWLTAPGPIVVLSFDRGVEGVVEQFADEKEIRVRHYDWEPSDTLTQEDAVTLRDTFAEDFEFACANARTVVVDKESQLWEIYRYAEFGAPSDRPSNYSALNQRYKKLLQHPKKLNINVGYITDMKEKWKTVIGANGKEAGKPSGEMMLAGYKELGGLVNVELYHERRKGKFITTPGKARGVGAADIQDVEFENYDFKTLGMMLFPDSDEEAWV